MNPAAISMVSLVTELHTCLCSVMHNECSRGQVEEELGPQGGVDVWGCDDGGVLSL